jgi:hypothetical protein
MKTGYLHSFLFSPRSLSRNNPNSSSTKLIKDKELRQSKLALSGVKKVIVIRVLKSIRVSRGGSEVNIEEEM